MALEIFDDLDVTCPGCDRNMDAADLCECFDNSGPMCLTRCCDRYHHVGTGAHQQSGGVMTLHTYPHIEQRSDEWRDLRCGMVTASTIGELITPANLKVANNDKSRGLIALLAAERIIGYSEFTYVNFDMQRGIDDEPKARAKYAEHHGVKVTEMGFMIREQDGWQLGFSPDGLVGDDGAIEVKCPRPKTHVRTIVDDEVPPYYMAQLQAGLFVTGRDWIDFVSYCAGLPLWTKRAFPDDQWFDAIAEAVPAAEKAIEQMVQQYRESVVGLPETDAPTELERLVI